MISVKIDIRRDGKGRTFEGIGGITSNGMSKLLMDYPEAQREDILHLLFKPYFGASLQHLKVEIGSDVNTSCGTEPSHMRSEDDFDITRGYGLPIAKKAKEINPQIYLDALRWGTPGWITDDEKKFLFYKSFLEGAREVYGLAFDYLGPDINEGAFSRDWTVNTLRPGLNRHGFQKVKLVAADDDKGWDIADQIAKDPGLKNAVYALGVHYRQTSTENAVQCGKPLWLSEDLAPFRHSFVAGALDVGYRIIKMYASGKMVKYEIHPLVEAEYENTPFSYKGILVASWPWSGHYRVDPGLWVVAHFTQFAAPGWKYVDSGCGWDENSGYVTLESPDSPDLSIMIVNKGSGKKRYELSLPDPVASPIIHVWKTNEKEHFIKVEEIKPDNGTIKLEVEPCSIYSLTTTTGQQKGRPVHATPGETGFKLPYREDFQGYSMGTLPKYTLDQGGAFEIGTLGNRQCLQQVITQDRKPRDWTYRETPDPYTLLGSLEWTNYLITVDARFDAVDGYILLGGRVNLTDKSSAPPEGYCLVIRYGGDWELKKGTVPLREGILDGFAPNTWNRIGLAFCNNTIIAFVNGRELIRATDGDMASGQIAFGSGYHPAWFDNLSIGEVAGDIPVSCSRYDDRDPRIHYSGEWTEEDGNFNNYARSLKKSCTVHACMEFAFHGTDVSIIGKTGPEGGRADVYLEDAYITTIDTCRETAGFRKALFSKAGLAPGKHTLKLVVKAQDGSASPLRHICIDAVEILGGEGLL